MVAIEPLKRLEARGHSDPQSRAEGTVMPEEVAFFCGQNVRSSVRRKLRRVAQDLYSASTSKEISIQLAREAAGPVVDSKPSNLGGEHSKTVADYYKIKVADMYSKNDRPALPARQIAMATWGS
jgi:chromosomal replication initiator protein